MSWDVIQQIIRIVLYAGASAWLGQSVADGTVVQAGIAGAIDIGAFIWWALVTRNSTTSTTS